ncbi:hypothetical protein QUF94_17780 [Peribacillus sp. NJ4]|uniref:hypothetical protein n=1 Tax=Peribacillus sp. NJ4 TaxID=3055862 RepID=UPI0025A18496|nr:hypothetical protein [Peribacillus sp. NJ4]MDM5213249.1 hypothetical protein [Peribacillus sp. NJ4]
MGLFDFFKRKTQDVAATVESKSIINVEEVLQEEEVIQEEQPKKEEPIKRLNFLIKGTFVEEHQKAIKRLVKELKQAEYFYFEPYDGLKNKEIKEDYFEERVYEYGGQPLPKGYLESEDSNEYDKNAIKVLLTNLDGEKIHIGYVPKELCLEIRSLKEKYETYVAPTLEKGKYKMALYDEFGEEKVKTYTDEYEIKLSLSFWETLPESLKNII